LDNNARLDVAAATVPVDEDLYAAGMTSQASVNVMLALEEAFDFEFPPEMLTKTTFRSVANISEALRELGIDATQEPE
jgi:acyl carrier protein